MVMGQELLLINVRDGLASSSLIGLNSSRVAWRAAGTVPRFFQLRPLPGRRRHPPVEPCTPWFNLGQAAWRDEDRVRSPSDGVK
jgi:hypothetical protein